MTLELTCGKCNALIHTMRILKPVKDVLRSNNNKCPFCGKTLSATNLSVSVKRI